MVVARLESKPIVQMFHISEVKMRNRMGERSHHADF